MRCQALGRTGLQSAYDGNGIRVEKSNGSTGTLYWRAFTGDAIAETGLTGSTSNSAYREYIFFAGRRVAWRDTSGNVFFYYADHLGSTNVVTTANGTPCYQATFTPYGEEHPTQNTCTQNYKFTGYERDAETGPRLRLRPLLQLTPRPLHVRRSLGRWNRKSTKPESICLRSQ